MTVIDITFRGLIICEWFAEKAIAHRARFAPSSITPDKN